jgi:hypothetical protein
MTQGHSRSRTLGIAIFGTFCVGGALAEDHPSELRQAVTACSTVKDPTERLACFDKLTPGGAPPAVATAPVRAPQSPAPPAVATAPVRTPESPEDFGLSGVQITPRREQIQVITAQILVMGRAANGRVRLSLDNGQSWEIEDAPDQLLAAGNSVTIQRASLGSYLMTTPLKATHRVRRVK